MKRIGLLILTMIMFACVQAQQFGGFPPSTKWRQINSDTARIIFTPGAEAQANRIATLIHRAAADTPAALGKKLRKVNIVLQSRTTLANGYVALGPFRSEYYLVPGSNIFDFGSIPWHEQLALHEYRHVQQYNNFNNGITRGFYFLFGEQGQAFANAITIPDWFFEGDAVHTETALSPSGRGRTAYFWSGYNSLWLERKNYSWQKLRNGSLKDYVPNHYQLGYLLANYGYITYGKDFWKNVTNDASRFRGLFYPLQKAIRKYSGLDYKTFRENAFEFYRSKQEGAVDSSVATRNVTDIFSPQYIGQDSVVYLRKAYDRNPVFYLHDHSGEHRISRQSISSEEWFSYRDGMIAYTAYSTDARWSYVDYSDIVLLDATTGHEHRITSRSKYYSPDISPSGNYVSAVHVSDSLAWALHLINISTKEVKAFAAPKGSIWVNPKFIDEDHIVVALRSEDSRMSLQLLDLRSGTTEQLVQPSFNTIGLPSFSNGRIFFTASFAGNDDIYEIDPASKSLYRLSSDRTGNYFASAFGDSIMWSHFTSNGLQLRTSLIAMQAWRQPTSTGITVQQGLYPVALSSNILDMRTERFSAKRYPKGTKLFNFHSWAPSYSDPEFTFSLYGNNILNTFTNEIYYRYNQDEHSNAVGWNSSYGGLYAQLNGGAEYIFDRLLRTTSNAVHYNQYELRGGYSIPLNFTKGKTNRRLNVGSDLVYSNATPTGKFRNIIKSSSAAYLSHFVSWSQYLPFARQHIYPKFGYTASLNYRHRLDGKGNQFLGSGQLFLPSIGNHSIVLQASVQETDTSNTIFSNRFAYSRGYEEFYFSRMWRLAANYHFPIVYPDFGIASIVYFQRLRGNGFYDLTRVFSNDKLRSADLRSVGGELYFDTRWWNQLPVSFGLRVSYLLDNGFLRSERKGNTFFEFILPLDLIPN